MWLYLMALLIFVATALRLLHIPLPPGIADRRTIAIFELLLRLGNEYAGDLVENVFGPIVRNRFTRFLMGLGFVLPYKPPPNIQINEERISEVNVRIYRPSPRKSRAALIFIHGGGWATMKPREQLNFGAKELCNGYYDMVLCKLVKRINVNIYSIDYRLAPEHPYPAAVDDCDAVIRYLSERAEALDIDPEHIGICGDSAGGNLSAVMAQRHPKLLSCQVLIYPVTSIFAFHSPSYLNYYKNYKGTALLNPRAMARWILFYLGLPGDKDSVKKMLRNQHLSKDLRNSDIWVKTFDPSLLPMDMVLDTQLPLEYETDEKFSEKMSKIGQDPAISPIFGVTSSLPPSLVLTSGIDVLRDEGILYAKRLRSMGNLCEWKHFPSGYHGVFSMPNSLIQTQFLDNIEEFLQKHLLH